MQTPLMDYSSSSLILFIIFSSLCYILLHQLRSTSSKPKTHNLRAYPIVGYIPQFFHNTSRIIEWTTELLASSPSGTVTLPPFIFTANPQIIEYITKTNFTNYEKPREITGAMQDLLGHGILNLNGDEWRAQRKLASYEFNAKSLRSYLLNNLSYQIDARLVPFLRNASMSEKAIDLQDVLERFASDNICKHVLGKDPDCLRSRDGDGDRFFHAFDEATKITIARKMKTPMSIWRLKKLLNIGSEKRLKEMMKIVGEFIDDDGRSDFLSAMVEPNNDHECNIRRDALLNFVLAGRDTTPSALTWFFWNISSRPDVVEKIRAEIGIVRWANLEDLRKMNYLHAAILESMRLYPPVPLLPRSCVRDDLLPDGSEVKRGWMVMYNAYAMARMEDIWGKDCREYRPERWLAEDGVYRAVKNAFEYPVFHAGPRVCLGKEMAYMQMKAVAARVLEVFDVEVVEERWEYQLELTMKMKGGLPVRIREIVDESRSL